MRRVLLIGGMALMLASCANGGNGSENADTTTSGSRTSDPSDTIDQGYGAGSDGKTNNGAGTATGPGTGAAAAGGSTTGTNAGTGGDSTNADTTNRQ